MNALYLLLAYVTLRRVFADNQKENRTIVIPPLTMIREQKFQIMFVATEDDVMLDSFGRNIHDIACSLQRLHLTARVFVELQTVAEFNSHVVISSIKSRFRDTIAIAPIVTSTTSYLLGKARNSSAVKESSFPNSKSRSLFRKLLSIGEYLLNERDTVVLALDSRIISDFSTYIEQLITSRVDISIGANIVPCLVPNQLPHFAFEKLSSNEGFMFFRYSHRTVEFMRRFATSVVDTSSAEGGLLAALRREENAQHWPFCKISVDQKAAHTLKYCFASEFYIQTTEVIDVCAADVSFKRGMLAHFTDVNRNLSAAEVDLFTPMIILSTAKYVSKMTAMYGITTASSDQSIENWACVTPQTSELAKYLYDNAVKELPTMRTLFGQIQQNSVVSFTGSPTVYVFDRSELRAFPSGDIFVQNDFQWKDVKRLDRALYCCFRKGEDVTFNDACRGTSEHSGPRSHTRKQSHGAHGHHQLGQHGHAHGRDHRPERASMQGQGQAQAQTEQTRGKKAYGPSFDETMQQLMAMWQQLVNRTYDSSRSESIRSLLRKGAGVYKPNQGASSMRRMTPIQQKELQNTVLINVAFVPEDATPKDSKYLAMLRNWYCYAEQYGFNPITYIVPTSNSTSFRIPHQFHEIGLTSSTTAALFASYPLHLFWSLLAKKVTNLVPYQASYQGDVPSFVHHGALVMLVPIFEALLEGFNVIYLDLDVLMARDPIPFMTKGNSDFTVQVELRNCFFPSSIEFATDLHTIQWEHFEPNTGIFFARSTPTGIDLFTDWMTEIVKRNVVNDQKALEFRLFGAKLSFSCNEHLAYLEKNITFMSQFKNNHRANASTYCYLNELQFQNGKVALHCARGHGGSKAEYMIEFHSQNIPKQLMNVDDVGIVANSNSNSNSNSKSIINNNYPMMLHFNFCDDKLSEYRNYKGWLVDSIASSNQTVCRKFNESDFPLAKIDWDKEVKSAVAELDKIKSYFSNGTAVKLHRRRVIHLVVDGVLREIPDSQTFDALGLSHSLVKTIPNYNFLRFLKFGPPIPSSKQQS